MASIAKLNVQVTADGAAFKAGLDKSAKDAQAWTARIGSLMKSALPVVGAGMLVGEFRRIVEEMDNVADNATRAGVPLKDFMNIVGTLDSEDTALATEAMKKLRKSMAELMEGNAGKIADFRAAGIDSDIKYDNIATAVQKVAKAWAETTDPLKKFNIEFAAFSKTGVEVSAVLDKLAKSGTGENRFGGLNAENFEKMKKGLTDFENALFRFKGQLAMLATDPKAFWDFATSPESGSNFVPPPPPRTGGGMRPLNPGETFADWLKEAEAEAAAMRKAESLLDNAHEFHIVNRAGITQGSPMAGIMRQVKNARMLGAAGWGQMAKSSRLDLGRDVMDRARPFMDNLSATSGFMGRGSAEEGAFKARFEQSQVAAQTTNQQLVNFAKQSLDAEKKIEARLAEIGKLFIQQKPPVVLSLGGA